jgi:Kef-type K+ transport system membrane component KefB/CBS domain-containing protein
MIAELTSFDLTHLPGLVIIGLAVLFGTLGAKFFGRFRIPQVVGYIVIGLIVGRTGFKLINAATLHALEPFNYFALGMIGFMIGGELHRDVFRKYGRQFFILLFAEGFGAFIIVSLLVGTIATLVTGNRTVGIALGLVLGAISTATAPAATVNVLWECKARGMLTSAVFAIVALDDALALVLFSLASSAAVGLMGHGEGGILASLTTVAWDLGGGIALGALAGFLLNYLLRRDRNPENALTFIIGALALVIGLGRMLKVDIILAAMVLGMAISNLAPRRSRQAFTIVERFAPPIFVLFFVSVGAQLNLHGLPGWMWALAIPYVLGRTGGKMLGAWTGAIWAKSPPAVRKYLGFCLFSQAGVAVGLSISASNRFPGDVGNAVIMIIALTTFIVQIIGPPCVKIAVTKAGEAGLNVTEDDLMHVYKVRDMVDTRSPRLAESDTLSQIMLTISATTANAYPVVDQAGKLTGIITLEGLKEGFRSDALAQWLLACDLMQPVPDAVTADTPLDEAMTRMREQSLEFLPVVGPAPENRFEGMLELRAATRRLAQEVLRRQQLAEDTSAA